jgi:hypothetical protein
MLEAPASLVDEIEPHVRGAIVVAAATRGTGGPFARELDRPARHLAFGELARLRDPLHDVPVLVAGGEVHPAVEAARILAQLLLHDAHRLDEVAPVHGAQESQAADGVADGDLRARLLLGVGLHQVLDRESRLGQALLDPGERQRESRALSLQAPRELGDERAHHRRVRTRHVGDHQDQVAGIVLGGGDHLVGPCAGAAAVDRAGGDPHRDPPQVLDEGEAQHDRDRPQLAHLERRDRLVGGDEARETLGVDAAVAVGDRLEGEVVDARQPGRGPFRQARQLAAVALRQMPLGRADLLLDQVEIVEQPLRGGGDAQVRGDVGGLSFADVREDAFVRGEARQQPVAGAARREPVRGRKALAVLLHLVGAVELRSQRRFLIEGLAGRRGAAEARNESAQPLGNRRFAHAATLAAGRWNRLFAGVQTGLPGRVLPALRGPHLIWKAPEPNSPITPITMR